MQLWAPARASSSDQVVSDQVMTPASTTDPRTVHASSRTPLALLAVSILCTLLALVLLLLGGGGGVRVAGMAVALLVVPGLALMPRSAVPDPWARAAVVVGLSLAVETVLALAQLWSRLWHPQLAGGLLLFAGVNVLAVRYLRPTPENAQRRASSVSAGPLGNRLVARLIDLAAPLLLVAVARYVFLRATAPGDSLPFGAVVAVLLLFWLGLNCWLTATRGTTVGSMMMGQRIVDGSDGQPIGLPRAVLRTLLLTTVEACGAAVLVLAYDLLRRRDHAGWADVGVQSVVVPLTVAEQRRSTAGAPIVPPVTSGGPAPVEPAPAEPAPVEPAPVEPGPIEPAPRTPVRTVWLARLDDGRCFEIDGLLAVGRGPVSKMRAEGQRVLIDDSTQTVSREHFCIGRDDEGIFVIDNESTNGTSVTSPDGTTVHNSGRAELRAGNGSIVSFGKHWLTICREAS